MFTKELLVMKKIGDLVNNFFNEMQQKQGEEYISFNKSWSEIAGDKIAQNTEIKDIEDGNLIIKIDHMGWKQLIMTKEKKIIYVINKKFPELKVKKIKFYFSTNHKKTSRNLEDKTQILPEDGRETKNEIENSKTDMNNDFKSLLEKMRKRSEE